MLLTVTEINTAQVTVTAVPVQTQTRSPSPLQQKKEGIKEGRMDGRRKEGKNENG